MEFEPPKRAQHLPRTYFEKVALPPQPAFSWGAPPQSFLNSHFSARALLPQEAFPDCPASGVWGGASLVCVALCAGVVICTAVLVGSGGSHKTPQTRGLMQQIVLEAPSPKSRWPADPVLVSSLHPGRRCPPCPGVSPLWCTRSYEATSPTGSGPRPSDPLVLPP